MGDSAKVPICLLWKNQVGGEYLLDRLYSLPSGQVLTYCWSGDLSRHIIPAALRTSRRDFPPTRPGSRESRANLALHLGDACSNNLNLCLSFIQTLGGLSHDVRL